MSAKAKSKLTPEQQKATMTRVLQKIKPYGFFVVCSLIVAAVSVAAQLYIPILCGRDRKSTRLNSSHSRKSRMPSSA